MSGLIVGVVCAVLGLLVGSFLNVVIWRVPRGESIAHPPSHCPGCGHPIRPRDNIPVLSWLLLRGRCRDCQTPISWRYPAVEAATALAFGITGAWVGLQVLLLPMLWFVGSGIALLLIDIDVKRLPNAIVLPSIGVVAAGLVAVAVVEGTYESLLRAVVSALVMGAAFLALALIAPGGMGMGDVKLSILLGLVLGWFGVAQVIVGFFAAFLFGSLWGLGLMATGRAGRKTAIPFGPFMIVGAWFSLAWAPVVAAWYSTLVSG